MKFIGKLENRLNMGTVWYHSFQNLVCSHLLSKIIKTEIYETIILHVIQYGCETLPLTKSEEHKLRVYEKVVLRRTFGAKRSDRTA